MPLRIAAVQMDPSTDQLRRAERLLSEAGERGADYCLFPEMFTAPWGATDAAAFRDRARSAQGPTMDALRGMARRHRVNILASIAEVDGDRTFNSVFVLDRAGERVGRYRKNHLPDEPGWREKSLFAPSRDGYPVFEHEGLRFGIQVCWDNMFPEGPRSLALDGARVIFAPRATGRDTLFRWNTVLAANAMVNTVFVVTANRVGTEDGIVFGGGSAILDPFGRTLSEPIPDGREGLAFAELDLAAIARARAAEPFLANRRPGTYGRLTAPDGSMKLE